MDKAELIIETNSTFFLNALYKNNIVVYASTIKDGQLFVTVNYRDLKRAEELLTVYKKQFKVVKIRGFKYDLKNNIKRIGLIIGIIFFVFSVSFYSFWVTDIKIYGTVISDKSKIMEVCEKYVNTPILKRSFDIKAMKRELVNIEYVSSVEVEKRGSNIIVTVLEELPKVGINDILFPTPHIAKKNGIITRMVVMRGTPLKKIGETAKVGDILVAPYYKGMDNVEIKVKTLAEIYGRTQYQRTTNYPYEVLTNIRTGKKKTITSINILGYDSMLVPPFKNYEIETTVEKHNNVIPFKIYSHTFYEVEAKVTNFDFDNHLNSLIEKNTAELHSSVTSNHTPIRTWYTVKRLDKSTQLDIYYEVEELI